MKRIVLRFGLASGVILMALSAVTLPLCLNGTIDFDHSEVVGYSAMVLAFLLVFFGVRSYRDNVATAQMATMAKYYDNLFFNIGITFMEVFPVGLIVTLVSAAILRRKPRQEAPASAVAA